MPIRCFISYARESNQHSEWVLKFAKDLCAGGIDVILDQWDLRPGADVLRFMEKSVRDSDIVLLICTPAYAERANSSKGGVGYEKAIVSSELYENSDTEKFIPILRLGASKESIPSYMKSRLYVDFREGDNYVASIQELIRTIYGNPSISKPPVAPPPDFEHNSSNQQPEDPLKHLKEVFAFAHNSNGLAIYSKTEAMTWAENWLGKNDFSDFPLFKKLLKFAHSGNGIAIYNKLQAASWVSVRLKRFKKIDFNEFRKAFRFAHNSSGLAIYAKLDAANWAFKKLSKSNNTSENI